MARGSELARGPLLGLKLSSISSSRLVSSLSSAHLGLDSALPGWVPGDRLGYAAETTLDLVQFFFFFLAVVIMRSMQPPVVPGYFFFRRILF